MKLTDLSRCTGFPLEVLRSFAEQGILVRTAPETDSSRHQDAFDGKALLKRLEVKR